VSASEIPAARVRVWSAFSDQFLDTETRTDIPYAALRAVEAGLSVDEAAQVWRHEVMPVVGGNLLSVAGEWVGWSDAWLVEHIGPLYGARRGVGAVGDAALGWLVGNRAAWDAIAGCMRHLLTLPAEARAPRARTLAALAAHAFDFLARPLSELPAEEKAGLPLLSATVFLPLFRPLVLRSERESPDACAARVEQAIAALVSGEGAAL